MFLLTRQHKRKSVSWKSQSLLGCVPSWKAAAARHTLPLAHAGSKIVYKMAADTFSFWLFFTKYNCHRTIWDLAFVGVPFLLLKWSSTYASVKGLGYWLVPSDASHCHTRKVCHWYAAFERLVEFRSTLLPTPAEQKDQCNCTPSGAFLIWAEAAYGKYPSP